MEKMEGDRILRNLRNQWIPDLVKDVKNFLSHMEEGSEDSQDASVLVKYQNFSLKLLRCCIEGFENSKADLRIVLQTCKIATEKLEKFTSLLLSKRQVHECQFDRLVKLLYHVMLYLHKSKETAEFIWFSNKILYAVNPDQKQINITGFDITERNRILFKLFEMHWSIATNNTTKKLNSDDEILIKLLGFQFILECKEYLPQFGKYLESFILKFTVDNKNRKISFPMRTTSAIAELINKLYQWFFHEETLISPAERHAITGHICLIYKFSIDFISSNDFLEPVTKFLSVHSNSDSWMKFHEAIDEAYKTKIVLCKLTGSKKKREYCKYSVTFKRMLSMVSKICKEIFHPKLLWVYPNLIIICDLTKALLNIKETLCENILIDLCEFAKIAGKSIYFTQKNLLTQLENQERTQTPDNLKSTVSVLCTQWYSYVCWILQTITSCYLKNQNRQGSCHCSFLSNSSTKRQDVLTYTNGFLKEALMTLDVLMKLDAVFPDKEYKWLGTLSYNLAEKAQGEKYDQEATNLYEIAIQASTQWVQFGKCDKNGSDVFTRLQQTNIVMKHKLLLDILAHKRDFRNALSSIATFVKFLLDALIDTGQHDLEDEIEKEIGFWVSLKQTALSMGELDEKFMKDRFFSKMLQNVTDTCLKLIMDKEYKIYKQKNWNDEIEDLLIYMDEKFGEADRLFVSRAVIDYAISSCTGISHFRRLELLQNTVQTLEQSCTQNAGFDVQDMLAISHFHMGYFQHKYSIINSTKLPEHKETQSAEFLLSFNAAVDIWTLLLHCILENSKAKSCGVLNSFEKSADYLLLIGFIYSLHHQHLNAVHAFHLSSLMREANKNSLTNKDSLAIRLTARCEMIHLLSSLYDVQFAAKMLDQLQSIDIENDYECILSAISTATILNRIAQCVEAEKVLKSALRNKMFLLKTPRSYIMKIDLLLALAASQEKVRDTYLIEDNPIVCALKALKISKCLFKLFFKSDFELSGNDDIFNDSSSQNSYHASPSPWCVLDRLLSCLLYLAQIYRFQGCIREATFHVKEGLLLCEKFLLIERKLEFLMEEAKICLITHEFDSIMSISEQISYFLNCKYVQNTSNTTSHKNILRFFHHDADCACEFCSEPFLNKVTLQYLILCEKLASVCSKDAIDAVNIELIQEALKHAIEKAETAIEGLRNIMFLEESERETLSISNSNTKKTNVRSMLEDYHVSEMGPAEISRIFFCEETITVNCLQTSAIFKQDDQKLSISSVLDCLQKQVENLEFRELAVHKCRRAIVVLFHEIISFVINCKEGYKVISLHWKLDRIGCCQTLDKISSELSEGNAQKDAKNFNSKCVRSKRNSSKRGGTSRQTRNIREDKRSKRNDLKQVTAKYSNEDSEIVKIADQIKQICLGALSMLVPHLDCLLIKRFYHLLSLVTGYRDVETTICLEQLSYARTLQQQMITRAAKKIGDKKREECEDSESMKEEVLEKDEMELQHIYDIFAFTNEAFAFQNHQQFSACIIDSMPEEWRICSMRITSGENKHLVITRSQAKQKPLLLKIPLHNDVEDITEELNVESLVRDLTSAFQVDPIEELNQLLEDSRQSLETSDVRSWWQNRRRLDEKLQRIIDRVENEWLGCWKGILLGTREDSAEQDRLEKCVNEFCEMFYSNFNIQLSEDYIKILIDSYMSIDRVQAKKAFMDLLGDQFNETVLEFFFEKADDFYKNQLCTKSKKTPGKGRIRRLRDNINVETVRRSSVILILDKDLQKIPWETLPIMQNQIVSRMPSIMFIRSSLYTSKHLLENGVNVEKAFYVLNPRKDLADTQKMFEKWFQTMQGWSGIIGKAPTQQQYKNALENYDVFIYCGHGNGQEFLRGDEVQRIQCRAASFLMGCSSGRLKIKGELEAHGMALHYLAAGCPTIVANLWDVTDKDIDRFLAELLKRWLGGTSNSSLSSHMTEARNACLLPYLVGASPVIYGLPIIFKNRKPINDT